MTQNSKVSLPWHHLIKKSNLVVDKERAPVRKPRDNMLETLFDSSSQHLMQLLWESNCYASPWSFLVFCRAIRTRHLWQGDRRW